MDSRTLFLHPHDTKGIVVRYEDTAVILNWFGQEYEYTGKGSNDDEKLLSWARKNCKWSQEEHSHLKGSSVINPFTGKTESYTLRGINPKLYRKGEGNRFDMLTVPSIEEVEVSIAGTVLEVSHSRHPSWSLLNLDRSSKDQLLKDNYITSSNYRLLLRADVSAPILVGNLESINRMSEEMPHLHKVVTIDELLKGNL